MKQDKLSIIEMFKISSGQFVCNLGAGMASGVTVIVYAHARMRAHEVNIDVYNIEEWKICRSY